MKPRDHKIIRRLKNLKSLQKEGIYYYRDRDSMIDEIIKMVELTLSIGVKK